MPALTVTPPLAVDTGVLYVRSADLDASGKLKAGVPVEPLVLRASAGECVEVTLQNRLPAAMPDLASLQVLPGTVKRDRDGREGSTTFNYNLMRPSSHVGLHPQLVEYDVTRSDGTNVGQNPVQTAAPGASKTYQWYAGDLGLQTVDGSVRRTGGERSKAALADQSSDASSNLVNVIATPIEFGGFNLAPADKIKQASKRKHAAKSQQADHPVSSDPDLKFRLIAADSAERIDRELEQLEKLQ